TGKQNRSRTYLASTVPATMFGCDHERVTGSSTGEVCPASILLPGGCVVHDENFACALRLVLALLRRRLTFLYLPHTRITHYCSVLRQNQARTQRINTGSRFRCSDRYYSWCWMFARRYKWLERRSMTTRR